MKPFKTENALFLKQLGLRISTSLAEQKRSVDWLALNAQTARSTLREILAGRSNLRILTLTRISNALGFKSVPEFLRQPRDRGNLPR